MKPSLIDYPPWPPSPPTPPPPAHTNKHFNRLSSPTVQSFIPFMIRSPLSLKSFAICMTKASYYTRHYLYYHLYCLVVHLYLSLIHVATPLTYFIIFILFVVRFTLLWLPLLRYIYTHTTNVLLLFVFLLVLLLWLASKIYIHY